MPELTTSWCSISRTVWTKAFVNHGGFPLWAPRYWSRSSLRMMAVHYSINWRRSTVIWTYSHPIVCCFLFVLLPVLQTIFKCASWVMFLVATLAASQWTAWCLGCCCVPSSEALNEAPVVSLDSNPLLPVWGVCVVMTCLCGKGEEDDTQKKWEVLRNIYLASSQNRLTDRQLGRSTHDECACV